MQPTQGFTVRSPTKNTSFSHSAGRLSAMWANICDTTPRGRGLPLMTTTFIPTYPTEPSRLMASNF